MANTTVNEDTPLVIISTDSHVGPRLREELRPYCPQGRLREFDDYVDTVAQYQFALRAAAPKQYLPSTPGEVRPIRNFRNAATQGHFDMNARIRDMDRDGVAGEVIFHGSQNDEPVPFTNLGDPRNSQVFKNLAPEDPELARVGQRIYNDWLADACSIQRERHVGLAHLPIWDVEAALEELTHAKSIGLGGINFPCPQPWLPSYNDAQWEPLWHAAEDLDMPLVTHIGGGVNADYVGMAGRTVRLLELPFFGTRAIPWMIFSGVFERHPNLKLVITEIFGEWWPQLVADLDSAYRYATQPILGEDYSEMLDACPRLPSDYFNTNIFVGASFMSRSEARSAYSVGYYGNYMWGSDYPHGEGTYQIQESPDDPSVCRLALRSTFCGLPADVTAGMLGGNAARVYNFDNEVLAKVANRIDAPTLRDLSQPYDGPPPGVKSLAFRDTKFV